MVETTVSPSGSASYTFPQFVSDLDDLLSDSTISAQSSTAFTVSANTSQGLLVGEVTGVGFTYTLLGGELTLDGGSIVDLRATLDGVGHWSLQNIQIAGADLLAANLAEFDGSDLFAMDRLVLERDWIYNATDAADTTPPISVLGSVNEDFYMGGKDVFRLNGGDDEFFSGARGDQVFGGAGDDDLNGGTGNDLLRGGADDDLIRGDNGADRIYGDAGNDDLRGGRFHDTLYGGDGGDIVKGSIGNDTLKGGKGGDDLFGGDGRDKLQGGNGADSLNGNKGADTLIGGFGADTFVLGANWGADKIQDFQDGVDRIDVSNSGASRFSDLTISDGADGAVITWGANTATLKNVAASDLDAGDLFF